MSDEIFIVLLTVIGSVIASSGFWAWLQRRHEKNDVRTQMLLGIAHDRLTYLSISYIKKGSISKEAFENINKYLYEPYTKLGGNGTVSRLMSEVQKLPISGSIHLEE